jgi:hypothetical protein
VFVPLRRWLLSSLVAVAAVASSARAQLPLSADPAQAWRTFRSEHFRVHYREEHAAWARHVAERLEGIRVAVGREVGYLPPKVTDVVIDDPLNLPNGSATPFMDGPVMFFWPTPPDPASGLAQQTTWGELLSIHEFAHIAHLSRPAREPWERVQQMLPFIPHIGPIPRRVPAWVTEGYATLVEGRLSASGRPNSVWRAAVLRSWALEGLLPSYEGLDDGGPFIGGSMPYLLGSAYLEWLARARGDSSLPQLWRRLTARVPRDFPEAFTGSFGESPQAMYGQFTTTVTARALAVRAERTAAGLVEGERVARLEQGAGAPALSPDGSRAAVLLASSGGRPSRIEIWSTRPAAPDSQAIRAAARVLEDDPEDVADYSPYPRRPRAISTLWPVRGRGHTEPRFLPDGRRLLVTRMEPLASGALRPDLFLWDPRLNTVTRLTRGAGIRLADPTPDGTHAVGIRCGGGSCDVVEITLETGAVRVLQAGTPERTFSGARVSPDGRTVATAMHADGRWQIALVNRADGALRTIETSDKASRFAPAWMPDGRALAVVSEAGGVADLERLTLDGAATPLTRVLTATYAPDVARTGDALWFLTLHARGWDVRRLSLGGAPLERTANIALSEAVTGSRETPALTNPPAPATRPPTWPIGPVQDTVYGLGPRGWRLLPIGTATSHGSNGGFALDIVDPVGRLAIVAQGLVGDMSAWRGASLAAAWRGTRPTVELTGFWVREQSSRGALAPSTSTALDLEQTGGALAITLDRVSTLGGHHYAMGVLGGNLETLDPNGRRVTRAMAWLETAHRYQWVRGGDLVLGLDGSAHLARGATDGLPWTRAVASVAMRTGGRRLQLELSGAYGRVTSATPFVEQMQVGGVTTTLLPTAALTQRLEEPALAPASLTGNEAARARVAIVRGPVSLFWDAMAAGNQVSHASQWWRVAGVDARLPFETTPALRLPAIDLRAGGGYAFDDLRAAGWRAWFSFSVRP